MTGVDLKRLDAVVLAHIATANRYRKLDETRRALGRFRHSTIAGAEWEAVVAASFERVQRDAPSGRSLSAEAAVPTDADWEFVREKLLPLRALGVPSGGEASALGALRRANGWAAAIVARSLGLWTDGPPPTAARVGDLLVWQALGLRGPPQRTPQAVRAHFLRQKLRDASGEGPADRWLRQLAVQTVGGSSTAVTALRDALVACWIAGKRSAAADDFVIAVRDAARGVQDGRFGDRQVFIVSVWHALRSHGVFGNLTLDEFKKRLVEAHRAGRLALVRADLVAVMDPALVAESETSHLEARYHFLLEEAA